MSVNTSTTSLSVQALSEAVRSGTPLGQPLADELPNHRGVLWPEDALTQVSAEDIRAALQEVGDAADPRGLSLTSCLVEGDLDLSGIRGLPRLSFVNCRFDGLISLDLASALSFGLRSVDVHGISAKGLKLEGDLLLDMCRLDGELDLTSSYVGGRVDVLDTVSKDICADKLVVNSNMSWFGSEADSFTFNSGECRGPSSDTANNNIALVRADYFDITSALFTCSVGIGFNGWPNGARPAGRLGLVRLNGTHCTGDLDLCGEVESEIEALRLRVEGGLGLPSAESAPRGIDLTDAQIGSLQLPISRDGNAVLAASVDGTRSWAIDKVEFHLAGAPAFAVPSNSSESRGFDALIAWLPRHDRYEARTPRQRNRQQTNFAQPWMEVATALDKEGRTAEARSLRIEGTDHQKRTTVSAVGQVGRLLTWATIGHGYASFRALWLLLLTYVVTVLVVAFAASAFEPAVDENAPGMWSALYALDIVLSPVGTGQSELWSAGVLWLAVLLWLLKFVAWMLAGLFVSGIAGIVNRSSTS